MQPLFAIRDTSALEGTSLPAVLNEDAFWPFEPKRLRNAVSLKWFSNRFCFNPSWLLGHRPGEE